MMCAGKPDDLLLQLQVIQLGDVGDFDPVPVQHGYIEDFFKVFVSIIPDVGVGTMGFDQIIPLFPDPDGMSLNAREFLKLPYRVYCHGKLDSAQFTAINNKAA
jgi:hypothetical protein